jgi:hypothetical protein
VARWFFLEGAWGNAPEIAAGALPQAPVVKSVLINFVRQIDL